MRNGLRGKEKHSVGLEGNMIQKVKKKSAQFQEEEEKGPFVKDDDDENDTVDNRWTDPS